MKPPRICAKCGRKKGAYAHICPPEYVLRFERAERRALEIAARRYDPPAFRPMPGTSPEPIDLPAPAPVQSRGVQFIVVKPPRVSPPVLLLPSQLLGETSAQRAGEPERTAWRKYRDGNVSNFRMACRCPRGLCGAAALATRFHHLPWSYTAVLNDRPEAALDSLAYFRMTGLTALDALVSPVPRITDPFYVFSVVSHDWPFNPRRPTGLHVHLAVGNLTWDEFEALLFAWPGYVASKGKLSMRGREWKSLHYVLSQDPKTGDPLLDDFEPRRKRLPLRHILDNGMGQGHFIPPIFSPGLEDMGPFDKSKPDYIPGILTRFRARLPWGQTLKPRQRRKKGATS
jgi:hypothetical protein